MSNRRDEFANAQRRFSHGAAREAHRGRAAGEPVGVAVRYPAGAVRQRAPARARERVDVQESEEAGDTVIA